MTDADSQTTRMTKDSMPHTDRQLKQVAGRRISVIGASGSGKSYLAAKLANSLGIPLYQLDKLRNGPDGARYSDLEFSRIVEEIIATDEWILDGHYRSVRYDIWKRSESIFWLDYSMLTILNRTFGRYLRNKKSNRGPDLESIAGGGVPQQSASWPSRVQRVMRTIKERREYPQLLRSPEFSGTAIYRLNDPARTDELIKAIKERTAVPLLPTLSSNPPKVRIIELFGVPGSGKSTVSDVVAQELDVITREELSASWAGQSKLAKIGFIVRGLANPAAWKAAIALGIRTRLTSPESLARLVRMIAKRHWVRSQTKTLLLDQGFLQDIWSVLYGAGTKAASPALIAGFIAAMFRGTDLTILHLDLGADAAAIRIAGRVEGSSRLDQLPLDQVQDRLHAVDWIPGVIVAGAIEAGMRFRTLNASAPIEQVAGDALAVLSVDGFAPASS